MRIILYRFFFFLLISGAFLSLFDNNIRVFSQETTLEETIQEVVESVSDTETVEEAPAELNNPLEILEETIQEVVESVSDTKSAEKPKINTPGEDISDSYPETSGSEESSDQQEITSSPEEDLANNVIENSESEVVEPVSTEETQPQPEPKLEPEPEIKKEEQKPLSELTRVYDKKIYINKEADYKCEAEFFKVDMLERESALNTILLTKGADISYEIEIGSLPIGLDIKFTENDSYQKTLGSTEEKVDISITKKSSAPKGSFSVPIIYTQKGIADASVICQLNVVNL